MSNYGITFNVTGNSVKQMQQIESELKKLGVTAEVESARVEHGTERMAEKFGKLGEVIVVAFSLEKLREFATEVLHVTAEFEGFENRIKFSSLNITDAAQNMSFLREQVDSLHLPMRQVYEGFSEMEAGLRGTGIEGARLRDLFQGISTAAATLHLPEYQLQRTLYDLKEIGEIGLNARIDRSLSTALPGIGAIVQQTFGKSLHELQKDHSVSGTEFLTKLGPALQKNFASGIASYADSLQAHMADTSNKFIREQVDLGEKLKPVYISIMNTLTGVMDGVGRFINYLSEHKEQVKEFVKIIESLVIAFVAYKAITIGIMALEAGRAVVLNILVAAEYAAAFGAEGLTFALESMGVAFDTTAIGAFAVALGVLVQGFIELNQEVDEALEKATHLKEMSKPFETSVTNLHNVQQELRAPDLNKIQRGEIMAEIAKSKGMDEELTNKLQKNLTIAEQNLKDRVAHLMHPGQTKLTPYNENQVHDEREQVAKLREQLAMVHGNIQTYSALEDKIKKQGYTKPTYKNTMDPTGEGALQSTRLSGAEGGLGQAKNITINIGTVMRVEDHGGKDIHKNAELAADFIIRAANNYSESQSGSY